MEIVLPHQHHLLPEIIASKKGWIVDDKDDTRYDAVGPFLDWVNTDAKHLFPILRKTVRKRLTRRDYTVNWAELLGGIDDSTRQEVALAWHHSSQHHTIPPVEGVPESARYLANVFRREKLGHAVLTADRAFTADNIKARLEEDYPDTELLIFLGQWDGGNNNHAMTKIGIHQLFGDKFWYGGEDSVNNALSGYSVGASIAVPSQPWNRGYDFTAEIETGSLARVRNLGTKRAVKFAQNAIQTKLAA